MNVSEPAINDTESYELLQRMAERWAIARFIGIRTDLERHYCPELPDAVYRDLAEHGWLPVTSAELLDWSVQTVARLGQALGKDAGAAFATILTHVMAAQLLVGLPALAGGEGELSLYATSPFWDFSKVASPLRADVSKGGIVLDGTLPLVVNARLASHFVVQVTDAEGKPMVCAVKAGSTGVSVSSPIPMLGLRGIGAANVSFTSTRVEEETCVLRGEAAAAAVRKVSSTASWGMVGLLAGIVAKACDEASDYARLRRQGGRPIIDHFPVFRLVESMQATREQFIAWLGRLDPCGAESLAPLREARSRALTATDAAMQIFGGMGYMCPGIAERCWRDARQAAALCSDTSC